ncbi:MAG: thiamine pyrophosphokinase [Flammeovirgaceae bacterium]|jgi:thiamine pyrophosphokinase
MSSHHIVRDEQEPALILLDLADSMFDRVGELLEWSPVVVALPKAIPKLVEAQIKVDWAVFEPENEQKIRAYLEWQFPISYFPTSSSLLEFAFQELIAKNHKAVNVVLNQADFGKRLPVLEKYAEKIDLVAYLPNSRVAFLNSNFGGYEKWLLAATKLELSREPLRTKNMESLTGNLWKVIENGTISIEMEGGSFWVKEITE